MANWQPEVAWHERDVVVPAFRLWLEAQGWQTETETAFVDVVARRGNETIYAEVKGRTKSRPGAGLDTLYIADDGLSQLQKYSLVGGVWTSNGNITVTAADGADSNGRRNV